MISLSLQPKFVVSREQSIVVVSIAILLLGAAWAWMHPATPTPVWHVALLFDASKTAAPTRRCPDGRRLVSQVLDQARGDVQLVVFQTGDRSTGHQPIRLGAVSVSHPTRLLEGTQDDAARQQALAEADRLCAAVRVTDDSPLVDNLAAVSETMPASECSKPDVRCAVIFRTDGGEELNRDFIAALDRFPEESHDPTLDVRINNAHHDVLVCGVSERSVSTKPARRNPGGRPLPTYGAVKAAFARVVSHPERLRVEPFCAALQAAAAARPEMPR